MHDRALAVEIVALAAALLWGLPLVAGIILGGQMTFTIYDAMAAIVLCAVFGLLLAQLLEDLEKKIGSA